MSDNRPTKTVDYPPSFFAKCGQPMCSRWGKSEIEQIAAAYVQALANDGDTWKSLTREQTYNAGDDEQKRRVHNFLTSDFDTYKWWFQLVSERITDADGAFSVGGFWPRRPQ